MEKIININSPINPYTPLYNDSNYPKDKRKQIEYDIMMYENAGNAYMAMLLREKLNNGELWDI